VNPYTKTSALSESSTAVATEPLAFSPRGRDISVTAILVTIVCTGLALRLPWLGQKSLWIDEMWSIGIARLPWASFWSVVRNQDPNMSLYYSLLHIWMKMGSSEFAIRFMSVLFGSATIPVVYALGRRLFTRSVGLVAGVLLAVNVFHIQWSQEARSYTLVVFLAALSSLLFIIAVEKNGWRNWLAYVVVSVLAVYAHLFGVLVLAAHCVSLVLRPRRELAWKRVFTSALLIGILFTPLAALTLQRSQHTAVPFSWIPRPTLHGIYDVFYTLSGNGEFAGSKGGKPILVAYGFACLAGVFWAASMRKNERARESWRIGFLLCWLFVPLILLLLISLRQSMFLNRYLLICVPALALLAASAIGSMKQLKLIGAALLIMVGLSLPGLLQYYRFRDGRQEWKAATEYILTQAHPADAAIFYVAPGRLLFDYYQARYYSSRQAQLDILFPQFGDEGSDPAVLEYLPPLGKEILEASDQHSRVWLILYQDEWSFTSDLSQNLKARLAADYSEAQQRKFEKITVILYSRPRARILGAGVSASNSRVGF
jgi:mannosyltransferase